MDVIKLGFKGEQLWTMISGERESWERFYSNCPNFSDGTACFKKPK
jgi:hypothetical protein